MNLYNVFNLYIRDLKVAVLDTGCLGWKDIYFVILLSLTFIVVNSAPIHFSKTMYRWYENISDSVNQKLVRNYNFVSNFLHSCAFQGHFVYLAKHLPSHTNTYTDRCTQALCLKSYGKSLMFSYLRETVLQQLIPLSIETTAGSQSPGMNKLTIWVLDFLRFSGTFMHSLTTKYYIGRLA